MSEYEFTQQQDRVFHELTASLRLFAIHLGVFAGFVMLVGLLFAVQGSVAITDQFTAMAGGLGIMMVGALVLVFSFRLLRPIAEFREIITTHNSDISQMMAGLEKLDSAHRMLRIILILLLVSVVFGAFRVFG